MPAGAEISFAAFSDGYWGAYVFAREATAVGGSELAERDASAPALSPNGSRVAIELQGEGILVCPLAGGGGCETVKPRSGWAARPTWDTRSGELVFVNYTADAKGEDSDIVITRNGLEETVPLVTHTGNQDDPDVSPDGRWLAYSSAQTIALHRAGVKVVRHLWTMNLATGEAKPVMPGSSQDMQPDWSPDGKRLAFASNRSGAFEIWMVGADSSGLRQVTSGPGSKTWPAWSPDGSEILYAVSRDGRQGLSIVSADGSRTRPFEPFGSDSEIELRDPDWR